MTLTVQHVKVFRDGNPEYVGNEVEKYIRSLSLPYVTEVLPPVIHDDMFTVMVVLKR